MVQISDIEKLEAKDIEKLVEKIKPELNKRTELYRRYKRKVKSSDIIHETKNGVVPLERYIINVSSGYLGGKAPKYIVENVSDKEKQNIIKKLIDKIVGKETYQKEMEVLIDYITNYNDEENEHYMLIKNVLTTSACYEIIYENEDNEIVYSYLDPLQTVAIWDYNIPRNLIGLVRYYKENDINDKEVEVVELTDSVGTRLFKKGNGGWTEEKNDINNHNWGDVPAIVVEQEEGTALFEPVIDLIKQYEQLNQNNVNIFKYNDEAKLKITGYMPTEPLMTKDSNGNMIENDARTKEDETLLKAKVFYTPDKDGNIEWVEKHIDDGATQNTLKTLIDLVLMNTGVPNITDLGFTKADNASAIDRKFFTLEQMTIDIVNQLIMAYKRRWELIFNRINLKKNTKYDFRDIKIELQKNLPNNANEVVDSWIKLRGLVSDSTIIEHLPYNLDALVEQEKMNDQEEEQLEKDLNKQSEFNKINGEQEQNKQQEIKE